MEAATLQFGFDDAAVRAGTDALVARVLASKVKIDPALTLKPRVDNTAFENDLAQIRAQWGAFASRQAAAVANGGAGKAKLNAGLIGAQVQDIAVQLQGGTNALTVFAEQGSQLASIFGPTGMIVGGVAAIGGVLATVAVNSKTQFDAMINSSRALRADLDKAGAAGSLGDLMSGVEKLKAKFDELKGAKRFSDSFLGGLDALNNPKKEAINKEGVAVQFAYEKANLAALAAGEKEVRNLSLKLQGRDRELEALSRQETLQTRINSLAMSSFSPETVYRLTIQAREMAAMAERAEKVADATARERANREAIAGLKNLRETIGAQQQDFLPDEQKLNALGDRIKAVYDANGGFMPDGKQVPRTPEGLGRAADISQKAGDFKSADRFLQAQQTLLTLEAQREQIETRLGEQIASQTLAIQQQADNQLKLKQAAGQAQAEFGLEMQILEAKAAAAGKDSEAVDALDRQLRIQRLQQNIMSTHLTDAQTALNLATARVNAEDAVTKAVKARQQAQAQQNINEQIQVAQLQASGRNRAAQKLQAQINLKAKAKEIEDATGVSAPEAMAQAKTLISAQAKAQARQARADGVPVRSVIKGYSNDGKDSNGQDLKNPFRGLAALAQMQARGKVMAQPLNPAPVALAAAQKALKAKNQANAQAQNLAESRVSLTEGPQIITLLTTIKDRLAIQN